MDIKIRTEIIRLKNVKEQYQSNYVTALDEIQEKIERLELQLDRTTSEVKSEILQRQKKFYEAEIEKMDRTIESTTKFLDKKIEALEKQMTQLDKEKRSLDYNVEKLKAALERRNANEIFDMFEFVTNSLEIIKDETSRTPSQP
jgi:predicted  nucleic acid-binding Zn-ribbon protein